MFFLKRKKIISILSICSLLFFVVSCGSSDDDETTTSTYSITGGSGGGKVGAVGGAGGMFTVYLNAGSNKGDINVYNSGSANTTFTPSVNNVDFTVKFGAKVLDITSSTTVYTVAVGASAPTEDEYYILSGDDTIYLSDGDDSVQDETAYEGLHVKNGAVVTFEPSPTTYLVKLNFPSGGIFLESGTIAVQQDDVSTGDSLQITATEFYSKAGTSITTAGTETSINGGSVTITTTDGILYNGSSIITKGYNAATGDGGGGAGGNVTFASASHVENYGSITANGGTSSDSTGGSGASVTFTSAVVAISGHIYNSGYINTNGGNGKSTGGNGGVVSLTSDEDETYNSGSISAIGGNGTGAAGGTGASVTIISDGSALHSSGNITTSGGSTSIDNIDGSAGGDIIIKTIRTITDGGTINLSGVLNSKGGNATSADTSTGSGGASGHISISVVSFVEASDINLYGFALIDVSGGSAFKGGDGGDVSITIDGDTNTGNDLLNKATIKTNGGAATGDTGDGGTAGSVTLDSDMDSVVNTGKIYAMGGLSISSTSATIGRGGSVEITGEDNVTNTALIDVSGGDDTKGATVGQGNNAGEILLEANLFTLSNTGQLIANGGDGTADGGDAGVIIVRSTAGDVYNSSNISSNGGDGDTTGGNGNCILLYPKTGGQNFGNTGTLSASGGVVGGTDGHIYEEDTWVLGDGTGCTAP